MGTEVSEADIANVQELCDQVLDISEYVLFYFYFCSRCWC